MARTADPRLRQRWRELIESFDSTQETVGDFCRRLEISRSSFHRWRAKLSTGRTARPSGGSPRETKTGKSVTAGRRAAGRSSSFVPVNVVNTESPRSRSVQVHLPDGVSIEVPVEQKELLFELVAQVREQESATTRRGAR